MEFNQRRRVDSTSSTTSASAPITSRSATRKARHAGLFEGIQRLDAELDAVARRQLSDWIREQYEQEYGDIPLGFVAICYLGPPYVDHRLDLLQSIVDHYGPADLMPEPYAAARMMVRMGGYEFVEVYGSGQLVPVRADGSVVVS